MKILLTGGTGFLGSKLAHSLNVDGHFDIRNMIANPININYQVSILTKYQEDLDQILGNFVPFFNPDVKAEIW